MVLLAVLGFAGELECLRPWNLYQVGIALKKHVCQAADCLNLPQLGNF